VWASRRKGGRGAVSIAKPHPWANRKERFKHGG
jgi:hypothetical protein